MTLAGLKKCVPMTASGRDVAAAISSTSSVEVLVAMMAPGLQISSSLPKISFFSVHILEHRLDHHVGVRQIVHVGGAGDEAHALVHGVLVRRPLATVLA